MILADLPASCSRASRAGCAITINFLVGADAITTLVGVGWFDLRERAGRDAEANAVIALATRALALRIRPGIPKEFLV